MDGDRTDKILFVRNIPFGLDTEELYALFGKHGPVTEIRLGNAKDTRGTAYVVYEDPGSARHACGQLNGFHIQGRYLVVSRYRGRRE